VLRNSSPTISRVPIPAAFKHAVKQGWSFKQQARQV
jgi:hypothetical protein